MVLSISLFRMFCIAIRNTKCYDLIERWCLIWQVKQQMLQQEYNQI